MAISVRDQALALALAEAGYDATTVEQARSGYWSDDQELVNKLVRDGQHDLAERVILGEFAV